VGHRAILDHPAEGDHAPGGGWRSRPTGEVGASSEPVVPLPPGSREGLFRVSGQVKWTEAWPQQENLLYSRRFRDQHQVIGGQFSLFLRPGRPAFVPPPVCFSPSCLHQSGRPGRLIRKCYRYARRTTVAFNRMRRDPSAVGALCRSHNKTGGRNEV
jgi:hypothetical protein